MLQIKAIRENTEEIKKGLKKRGFDDEALKELDRIISLDDDRKATQTELDHNRSQINQASKEIGNLFKSGKASEANDMKSKVNDLKENMAPLEEKYKSITNQIAEILFTLPNKPHDLVPKGNSDDDNVVIKDWTGAMPNLPKGALPHWELAEKYKLIDFKLGVKITGAGFPVFRAQGAMLQRALINFFLDEARAVGYEEIMPPLLVNEASGMGTGSLPDKEGQMYYIEKDNLYVIPTAEIPVTNIMRDVTVKETELPIKFCAHTPCFRREAGSYGSDVKGLNRVHQFDKVEIVQIANPKNSYEVLDNMVDYVEGLLNKLELPHRILRLCSGDLSFASAMTYDFEVYSAAQDKWLEVSSVSNFETFQSTRMKCKYKGESGKAQEVHTLNGSALALARIVAALLENNQVEGGIKIPAALVPYTRFEMIT
ncbi:MAG: serine--tRNA ligase [Saprospiraceae bacterium]